MTEDMKNNYYFSFSVPLWKPTLCNWGKKTDSSLKDDVANGQLFALSCTLLSSSWMSSDRWLESWDVYASSFLSSLKSVGTFICMLQDNGYSSVCTTHLNTPIPSLFPLKANLSLAHRRSEQMSQDRDKKVHKIKFCKSRKLSEEILHNWRCSRYCRVIWYSIHVPLWKKQQCDTAVRGGSVHPEAERPVSADLASLIDTQRRGATQCPAPEDSSTGKGRMRPNTWNM